MRCFFLKYEMIKILLALMLLMATACDHKSTYGPETPAGITLGFAGEDYARSIAPCSDGGYFITGYTNSIRNNYDLYAIKTDKKFNIQWSKTFGNSFVDHGNKGIETSDGGFAMVGTITIKPGNNDLFCVKLDRRGKMLWSFATGDAGGEEGYALIESSDGGIVMAGSTGGDILLIKLDAQGHQLWAKTYGGSASDRAFDVAATSDGGLVVTGRTSSFGGVYSTFILKTDADGNQQWFTPSGGIQDEGFAVVEADDGGYVTFGRVYVGLGNYQIYMIKCGTGGSLDSLKLLGFTSYEEAYSVAKTRDGNFVVTGETLLDNYTFDYQTLVFKVTPAGQVLWVKSYGGEMDDIGYSVRPTSNGYVVAGFTLSYGHGNSDIYVLKLDEDGELR